MRSSYTPEPQPRTIEPDMPFLGDLELAPLQRMANDFAVVKSLQRAIEIIKETYEDIVNEKRHRLIAAEGYQFAISRKKRELGSAPVIVGGYVAPDENSLFAIMEHPQHFSATAGHRYFADLIEASGTSILGINKVAGTCQIIDPKIDDVLHIPIESKFTGPQ